MKREKKPELVYGEINNGSLVFAPRDKALDLARIHAALQESKTWGEFKSRIPQRAYEEVLENIGGQTFEGFCEDFCAGFDEEELKDTTPRSQLLKEYMEIPFRERAPFEEDVFDPSDVPGYCDGDWPEWLQQSVLGWMPQEVQQNYGKREYSTFNGPFLTFDPDLEAGIVAALGEFGFHCTRDDRLILQACGYDVGE